MAGNTASGAMTSAVACDGWRRDYPGGCERWVEAR